MPRIHCEERIDGEKVVEVRVVDDESREVSVRKRGDMAAGLT